MVLQEISNDEERQSRFEKSRMEKMPYYNRSGRKAALGTREMISSVVIM